jgi:peptidoglycan hydrolase-like protein with peptidoglycan-binding domain
MMIKTFKEFKNAVNEDFWDWLTGKNEEGESKEKSQETEPNVQDSELEDFYKTLQEIVDSNLSVSVEKAENRKYSKAVENIQVALSFLGYAPPSFKVDGFFGPDTAAAIDKFNKENPSEISTTSNDYGF